MNTKLLTLPALALAAVALAGCGSSAKTGDTTTTTGGDVVVQGAPEAKVWCLEPGEKLTAAFKRDYSERYMTKAACRFWLHGPG